MLADNSPASDPEWLVHRYDPVADAFHFRRVPRSLHRATAFLTDAELGTGEIRPVSQDRARAAARPAARLHLVLHSAFCCSTLLARALDVEGVATTLKEPVVLNDLVGWRHRGGTSGSVARALDTALLLLARPLSPEEAVVVKPSNVVNAFAPAMLAMRPQTRAVLQYAPLPVYLNSIARKGMEGRLWVRDLLGKQLKDGLVDLGFTPDDYLGQTDLQVAATGWLAQQALFARLIAKCGPSRVRSLSSEELVADPERVLAALVTHFELPVDAGAIQRIAAGPIFTRHAKSGVRFDAADRATARRDAADVHRDEIDKVAAWAEKVAQCAGVPMTLGAPVLG